MSISGEALQFPLEALYEATVELLDDAGIATPHTFGERHLAANAAPPRYVWVPSVTLTRREVATRNTSIDHRPIASTVERCELHCWGQTFAQAWALRCNAWVAIRRLGMADVTIENGQWIRPGTGWNQAGEVYVLAFSLVVPTLDVLVDPGASPLWVPGTDGIVPVDVLGSTELRPEADVPGEIIITES